MINHSRIDLTRRARELERGKGKYVSNFNLHEFHFVIWEYGARGCLRKDLLHFAMNMQIMIDQTGVCHACKKIPKRIFNNQKKMSGEEKSLENT